MWHQPAACTPGAIETIPRLLRAATGPPLAAPAGAAAAAAAAAAVAAGAVARVVPTVSSSSSDHHNGGGGAPQEGFKTTLTATPQTTPCGTHQSCAQLQCTHNFTGCVPRGRYPALAPLIKLREARSNERRRGGTTVTLPVRMPLQRFNNSNMQSVVGALPVGPGGHTTITTCAAPAAPAAVFPSHVPGQQRRC